jgi:hypothetical protein
MFLLPSSFFGLITVGATSKEKGFMIGSRTALLGRCPLPSWARRRILVTPGQTMATMATSSRWKNLTNLRKGDHPFLSARFRSIRSQISSWRSCFNCSCMIPTGLFRLYGGRPPWTAARHLAPLISLEELKRRVERIKLRRLLQDATPLLHSCVVMITKARLPQSTTASDTTASFTTNPRTSDAYEKALHHSILESTSYSEPVHTRESPAASRLEF